ncbi:MAG: beta-ketoacyl-[acyl-carrier-protein] synthase family protein [PVC group bacterium]|nr:beta-ketoacyl-[acyl-carrier-protein] synthase family protein [PVC group bacterium]
MEKKRVVITGIGVIAPNGMGKDAFWQALKKGKSGIKEPTLIDVTYFKNKLAGECSDFDAETFLGKKGLRNLDRSTKLVCSAAKMALEDASFEMTDDNSDDVGVVTATTLSISADIAKFSKEIADEGFKFTNPALFPPTTMNFPSSQISIRNKIKGFNTTVASGYTAGLDALKYAVNFISLGRTKAVLVAGVESLVFSNYVGFSKVGFLAGAKGPELSCPFDSRHNGIILGEGTAALLVESEDSALERNARIYGEVLGVKTFFDAYKPAKYDPKVRGLKQSMTKALESSGLSEEDIDYICASANSVEEQDKLETLAIKNVFGLYAENIPVSSIKSMIGESISANGVLQIAASLGAINESFIPPTINYENPDPECDLDYVPNTFRKQTVNNVLINNFGPGGNNAAAVIAKYD